uniref:Uncharacterized protein n=1 Tax=viral metagenome TaxID=1070528 RepID=A0A6M3KLP2_9ZZZZ
MNDFAKGIITGCITALIITCSVLICKVRTLEDRFDNLQSYVLIRTAGMEYPVFSADSTIVCSVGNVDSLLSCEKEQP